MLCCCRVLGAQRISEPWLLKYTLVLLLLAYQAGPGERQRVIRCTRVGACGTHVMARCGPSELNLSRG